MPATTGNFCAANGADDGQHYLPAMRVSREDERYLQRGRLGEPPRIVREQDDGARRAARDRGDVGRRLVQKRMPTRSIASPLIGEARARVLQHLDAAARQRRRHVVIVVVVAEDAEHAVRRRERSERFGRRCRRTARSPHVT